MLQSPADVKRELNTFLSSNSSKVSEVLGRLSAANRAMLLRFVAGFSSLPDLGVFLA